ncbi:MAG TPA: type II toxin-antitoxin system Phd/YefM family antitoxin [Gemmatimonadaceae bacterium]|nr:type II toxin-antitoxin system Phd/YefM family antitoxin [Gemmatimonadaceae bacterium]
MGSTSYSNLRENLAAIWDRVEDSQEPVIVERRGHQTMAILPAEELEGLRETAHLLRSPRNAARLLTALQRALRGQTKSIALEDLRAELGLDGKK